MKVVPTAIFDLDGTLVDTSGDMIAAANACLGAPVLNPATDASIAFAGGRAMLEAGSQRQGRLWAQAEIDAVYPDFLARYSQDLSQRSKIYPGARAAIDALCDNGWRIAICTNKPEALAQRLMVDLEWRKPFHALIGADTLPVRKPDPAPVIEAIRRAGGCPERAVMIGDSESDLSAAHQAGVKSVLIQIDVPPYRPTKTRPDAICSRFSQLDQILGKMIALP